MGRNIAENFNRLSRTLQTTDRHTDDRRTGDIIQRSDLTQQPVPRNRFYSSRTGSKTAGTRNRFVNIVSLTHCIICVLYESLFVNNKSRNIRLKLMRLIFIFQVCATSRLLKDQRTASVLVFTFSFIHSFVAFGTVARAAYGPGCPEAIHDDKNF